MLSRQEAHNNLSYYLLFQFRCKNGILIFGRGGFDLFIASRGKKAKKKE
jgi:hypothetical protein